MNQTPKTSAEARPQLLECANAGDAGAQYEMWGLLSRSAKDTDDQVAAEEWLKKAAEQGFADAEFEYGKCFDDGDGFPNESAGWYRKAAAKGHADAQYELGLCYASRYYSTDFELVDVEDRTRRALTWITKAAQQGHPEAQHMLGEIYLDAVDGLATGRIVNHQEACIWFRKAAEQGVVCAQVRLASLYIDGHGVPQNFAEAYYWLNIAAALRHTDEIILKRDEAANKLPQHEVVAAQIRATSWFDEHQGSE